MNEPISLGSQRDAVEARRLCDELGHCCEGHNESIVAAAISGLLSMIPLEIQMQIAAQMNGRIATAGVESLPLPGETQTTIETIMKGLR